MDQGKFIKEKTTDYFFFSIDSHYPIICGIIFLIILIVLLFKRKKIIKLNIESAITFLCKTKNIPQFYTGISVTFNFRRIDHCFG